MAFDEALATRVGAVLADEAGVIEKKMFGGLCYMVNGHMCCGIVKDQLMLRVGAEQYQTLLAKPHAREMDFTGRALKGMLYIDGDGIRTKRQLNTWIERALNFNRALDPK